MAGDEVDYLIVGSGVAGALIAERIRERRAGSVLILEAGGKIEMRNERRWLDALMSGRLPYTIAQDQVDEFTSTGPDPWNINGGRLIGRGGSTIHWGGWCPRFQSEDFELFTRVGKGLDWPFGYRDIEPWYCEAEIALQVSGDSNARTHPRRSRPYPFEAAPFTQPDGIVIKAMNDLSISYDHMPIARNAKPIHGMPACQTIGTCHYCPIGARYTADQTLDRIGSDEFRLQLHAPARRILMDKKSHASGVEYVDQQSGETHTAYGRKIIICAGTFETPKLLLASANVDWPDGIGNQTDHVGRHLIANPYLSVRGAIDRNPNRWQQELNFATLCSRHWDNPATQGTGKLFLNKADNSPFLNLARLMAQGATTAEIEAAARDRTTFELQGAMQMFSHRENRILLGSGTTRFGLPTTHIEVPIKAYDDATAAQWLGQMRRILEAAGFAVQASSVYPQRGDHAMCTTRMSRSPADGVVDPDLRVHDIDNLYIVSNAVFPSGSAANPTLTLAALALRFAQHC
jgi:choline dehydrogenase-like flavoprotein